MAIKKQVSKKAVKPLVKQSVKSYQDCIEAEKQKMAAYSRKMSGSVKEFRSDVKSLQNTYRQYSKELKDAARSMRAEGTRNMNEKVGKYTQDIQAQISEHKEAVKHIGASVKYFISQINAKKAEFKSYARGPFRSYIKAFWGYEQAL